MLAARDVPRGPRQGPPRQLLPQSYTAFLLGATDRHLSALPSGSTVTWLTRQDRRSQSVISCPAGVLTEKWRQLGHEIGFGIGIAHGYATLGNIGFEGRFDYAAIGTVASHLCDEAKPGQILISPRVLMAVIRRRCLWLQGGAFGTRLSTSDEKQEAKRFRPLRGRRSCGVTAPHDGQNCFTVMSRLLLLVRTFGAQLIL